jgi:Chalcone isomerase-like
MKHALALLAALSVAPALPAGTLADVTFPDTITAAGHTLHLNGMGVRTKIFIKVYVGGLYLETITHDPATVIHAEEVKRVVMHFLYSHVRKDQLVDGWNDGFENNAKASLAALKPEIDRFNSFMEDVESGQEIVVTYVPGDGTSVSIAGKEKGTIPGKTFGDALFSIWFGTDPPTSALKKGMLGL